MTLPAYYFDKELYEERSKIPSEGDFEEDDRLADEAYEKWREEQDT